MGKAFKVSTWTDPHTMGYTLLGVAVDPLFWNLLSKVSHHSFKGSYSLSNSRSDHRPSTRLPTRLFHFLHAVSGWPSPHPTSSTSSPSLVYSQPHILMVPDRPTLQPPPSPTSSSNKSGGPRYPCLQSQPSSPQLLHRFPMGLSFAIRRGGYFIGLF